MKHEIPQVSEKSSRAASATERMRRWRQRRAAGIQVIPIEVNDSVVDALLESGWLSEWDAEDRTAVKAALQRLMLFLAETCDA